MTETGNEPGTCCSVDYNVTTEPGGKPKTSHNRE